MKIKLSIAAISIISLLVGCGPTSQPRQGSEAGFKTNASALQKMYEQRYGKTAVINFYSQDPEIDDMRESLNKLVSMENDASKICSSVSAEKCISNSIDEKQLGKAFSHFIDTKFGDIFKNQKQKKENPVEKDQRFGPPSDWLFVNSTQNKLANQLTFEGEVFKQVNEAYLREKGLSHFLDITKIERMGNTYVFSWVRGMKGTMGRYGVEFMPNGSLRDVPIASLHSSSGASSYMRTVFYGSKCVNNSQLLAYASTYSMTECPAELMTE